DKGVRGTRLEPDVEDVVDLAPFVAVVVRLEEARGGAGRIPGVGALLLERVDDAPVDPLIVEDVDRAVVVRADEDRDRHAPGTLPRDPPVGPALDHAGDAVLSLLRHPARRRDGSERAIA